MTQEIIDPRILLVKVAQILDAQKVSYFVTGGMAVFVWGRPRFTADIDIVVNLRWEDLDQVEEALHKLGKAGYVDKEMMREALKNYGEFNFIDGETGVKVDFWVIPNDPLARIQLGRRVQKTILKYPIYFISPEDLILNKLQWHKKSLSTRHLEDVQSVLKISKAQLDQEYLQKWIENLGLGEIWKQAQNTLD